MAPHQKRQRQEDDDNEIVAVERASSSLRGGPDTHRRKRVSINGPSPKARDAHGRDSTSSSSDSDEDMPDHDADLSNLPPATQYEIVRDGNFEHMEHTELDDQRATQRLLARQKKSGQVGNNLPAENAIIEEITCLNFMCHLNMHVKLGPLINFIVGENGSGKSAILTALSLCLGGKAAATNRGGSLKSFIKEGEENAVLIVRLKNQGDGAYQPDLFGESIIVERHFTKTGSAGFKLKNASGRIISNKKSDVEDVIEYFQLQVDNPMNILTQDAAKTFITQSNSKTKYLFFYKGTQLEQLDNDYKTIYELIDGAEAKKPVLEENLKAVAAEMKEALRKVEIVDQHQEMRDEKRRLRKLYAWAQVEAEERSFEKLEEDLAANKENVEQAVQVLEQKSQQFAESEEAISALEERIERLIRERDNVQDIESAAKEAQVTANDDVKRHHIESRKIQSELRAARAKVKSCQQDVNEEQKRIEAADGGAHAQKLAAVEQANLQCTEAREKYESHMGNETGFKTAIEIAGRELERVKEKLTSKHSEIAEARKRLDDIGRVGDPMAAFDPKIARLVEKIRHDQGFQQTPVGPAGMHIKLLNLDWSFVLESMLGACLGGFVVTSKADQIRLAGMIRELNINSCPIFIVPRNSLGDISRTEPDTQFTTMLKVLELNDDLVKKLLIINFKAEQTLLIKDSQEATRIMFRGGRPRNVSSCLAINEQRPGMGWRYTYSGQSQVTDYVKGNTGRPLRMRTERENQVAFQKAAIERLDRERIVLDGEYREAQQKVQRATSAHTQHKKLEQKLKIEMQKAQQNIENLKLDLDDSNIQDGKLEQLKIDLQEAEEEVALHENSYEQGVNERDRLNRIAKEKHEVVMDAKRNVAEAEAKLKKRQIMHNNIRDARSAALLEKNKAFEALDEAKSVAARSEAKRDKQAERVADFIAQAYQAVPTRLPLDEGMTVASIETTLSALTAQLNSYQKAIGGDDNKIREDAIKAKQRWDDLKAHTGNLERLIKALKKSLMLRLKLFRKFIRWISVAARSHFNLLLSERGFRGTMQLDHRAKLLEITVEPDETRKSAKGRGTKTLSGGEKSFSSICLLLSVWEAMGAPLRGLDEFDVFMDDINRDVSTKLLINGARDATGRQFIIISPKSISSGATEGAADVQIHKLIHPREQQRRITATGRLE